MKERKRNWQPSDPLTRTMISGVTTTGLDTSVWIENNADVYAEYLQEALDEFTDNTGLRIITD